MAEVLAVPTSDGRLRLDALLETLHRRGLRRLFVEGGGMTVSAFLAAGLLDRLQVAVTPLLIGEGRRGLSLPAGTALGDCLRPTCRVFRMGGDILFDCEPRGYTRGGRPSPEPALARVC
jgi:riboflavin biosynthesis pyrimidine reductase